MLKFKPLLYALSGKRYPITTHAEAVRSRKRILQDFTLGRLSYDDTKFAYRRAWQRIADLK